MNPKGDWREGFSYSEKTVQHTGEITNPDLSRGSVVVVPVVYVMPWFPYLEKKKKSWRAPSYRLPREKAPTSRSQGPTNDSKEGVCVFSCVWFSGTKNEENKELEVGKQTDQ